MASRSPSSAGATPSQFVDAISATLPIVDYDATVAAAHAALLAHVREQGEPRGAHVLIIAATARATGRTVVTADHAAFDGLPDVELRYHR